MNADFPRILTLLRKEKGISQKTAAGDLGISQALLSHYEKGIEKFENSNINEDWWKYVKEKFLNGNIEPICGMDKQMQRYHADGGGYSRTGCDWERKCDAWQHSAGFK